MNGSCNSQYHAVSSFLADSGNSNKKSYKTIQYTCLCCNSDFLEHWFPPTGQKWEKSSFFRSTYKNVKYVIVVLRPKTKWPKLQLWPASNILCVCECLFVWARASFCQKPPYCNNKSEKFKQLPYAHNHTKQRTKWHIWTLLPFDIY